MSQFNPVTIYTTRFCPYCVRAKQLLATKLVPFEEVKVDDAPFKRSEMIQLSGRRTVPQIWIGDQHIGGCDELNAFERAGQLDEMLGLNPSKPVQR